MEALDDVDDDLIRSSSDNKNIKLPWCSWHKNELSTVSR